MVTWLILYFVDLLPTSVIYVIVIALSIGVRLYFTTTTVRAPLERPSKLQLVHVRMPPGYAPSATSQRPSQVHAAFYRQGGFKGFFLFLKLKSQL